MACWAEEIFGPVASLRSFETEAEAVAEANACDRGLAAYLFSQDYAQVGDRRRWRYTVGVRRGGWRPTWSLAWSASMTWRSPHRSVRLGATRPPA